MFCCFVCSAYSKKKAYDNGNVYMWSTLNGTKVSDLPHDSRVSSLGVSNDGYAVATGCWDFNLRTYA